MNKFFKKQFLVGIEFARNEIRAIKFQYKHRQIIEVAVIPMPPNTFSEGRIGHRESLNTALQMMVEKLNALHYDAILALPNEIIIAHQIKLDEKLSRKEFLTELASNSAHYFPGPLSEFCFDFYIQADHVVHLFFARKTYLTDYTSALQQAGLTPTTIDVYGHALYRGMLACNVFSTPSYILNIENEEARLYSLNKWDLNEIVLTSDLLSHLTRISMRDNSIKEIFLIGDEYAKLQLWQTKINEVLGAPIKILNPVFANNQYKEIAPKLVTCYGLAIRKSICGN